MLIESIQPLTYSTLCGVQSTGTAVITALVLYEGGQTHPHLQSTEMSPAALSIEGIEIGNDRRKTNILLVDHRRALITVNTTTRSTPERTCL